MHFELGNMVPDQLRSRLLALLEQFSIERREVLLASGQTSTIYVDCRQIYFRGEAQFILGELLFKKMLEVESENTGFDACGGLAMGSIPLSCALSAAAFRRGRELPGFAVRKEVKEHGMATAIEGNKCLAKNKRVLILEDVVTTGLSALTAITKLRGQEIEVDTVFAIVDRQQGGSERFMSEGVRLYSLFRLQDLVRRVS